MRKIFNPKKNGQVKKGFTILELLVVVAIIAILAVIATPQFLGAIDKSRVSAQIADATGVGQALTMYNFDTSSFPLGNTTGALLAATEPAEAMIGTYTPGTGVTGVANTNLNALLSNVDVASRAAAGLGSNGTITGWNGPYMTTYPNVNRWGSGFDYNVVASSGATQLADVPGTVVGGQTNAGNVYDGASSAANSYTGLMAGQIVMEIDVIPAADAVALKKGIDSVTVASGTSSSTGQLRIDAHVSATNPTCYYVVH